MFTFDQVKELIDLTVRHKLQELEVESDGFRVRVRGGEVVSVVRAEPSVAALVAASPVASAAGAVAQPATAAPAAAEVPTPAAASDLHVVTSPIVGTFYASPSPDSPAFVKVGDRVRKGQVLCIVEAMKLMNEIESDVDGVVAEIHPKNAQPVEYGEPLFGVRRD
jgi:acetyl-CoA carboxylase biotin carboxyl carrier protein